MKVFIRCEKREKKRRRGKEWSQREQLSPLLVSSQIVSDLLDDFTVEKKVKKFHFVSTVKGKSNGKS